MTTTLTVDLTSLIVTRQPTNQISTAMLAASPM